MDDDNKPIDASIRPVLPSRQGAPAPEPMWSDPVVPVSSKPMRNIAIGRKKSRGPIIGEKPVKKPKDKKRSTIAKAAWQTRRKNAKGAVAYAPGPVLVALELASKLTHEELGGFMTAVAMLQHLPTASRKLVLDALSKVFP